nr:MAG: ORF1 [TTV-like mini virus]
MPYYWRNRRQRWRRRRQPYRWRARRIFQRRLWRQRRRRKYWVRRRLFKKKLLYIPLKQFQPRTIRRCNIIGNVCLFQGSPFRAIHNYVQYLYDYVPDNEPGGGGWTLMVESLGSLWEDFQHLKNVWTSSNKGLPLVKYSGVTLTFFQSPYTDYCVQIFRCYPMQDSKYQHADLAPSRMLLKRDVIKVPSLETRKKRKPYKKRFIPPPSQMQNKWYFQKDICDIPLIMIAATAVDLRYPFTGSASKSNNITLKALNPELFHRHDFDHPSDTLGYFPKPNTFLYATKNITTTETPTKKNQLIYLGNTKDNQAGKGVDTFADWGNIFFHRYFNNEQPIWVTQKPPSQLQDNLTPTEWTQLSLPLTIDVRYNPEKDTGEGNKIYLVQNYTGTNWDEPQNPDLILDGFPLYDMVWGFTDWQKKIKIATNVDTSWIVVINSSFFDQKLTSYVFLDESFIEGFGPYHTEKIPRQHQQHWSPKVTFQEKSLNTLGISGPGSPRPPYDNYMQAKMRYNFHVKWGGCPRKLDEPSDPCSQPHWNIPSNFTERLQIEDPETAPETQLQQWDWRRDYVKEKAIDRIQKHTKTDVSLQIPTESRHTAPVLCQTIQTTSSSDSESETEEKKTPSLQEQITNLKRKQQLLKHRILKRLKLQNIE